MLNYINTATDNAETQGFNSRWILLHINTFVITIAITIKSPCSESAQYISTTDDTCSVPAASMFPRLSRSHTQVLLASDSVLCSLLLQSHSCSVLDTACTSRSHKFTNWHCPMNSWLHTISQSITDTQVHTAHLRTTDTSYIHQTDALPKAH
jgi:hypothetical protein